MLSSFYKNKVFRNKERENKDKLRGTMCSVPDYVTSQAVYFIISVDNRHHKLNFSVNALSICLSSLSLIKC